VDMVSGDLLLLLPGLLVEEFLRQLYCIRPSLLLLYERDSFSMGL
jgi:hypothetical protein